MNLMHRTSLIVIILVIAAGGAFAYSPDDRFVDIATARSDIDERNQEISRLESENETLTQQIADNEEYLVERNDKHDKVEVAITRMNEAIADMLRIMSDMTDKAAADKFQQSIDESRQTRNDLMDTRSKLEVQIADTEQSLEEDQTQLNVNRAKIAKLQGEIETLNVQIARTEEQQEKLDFTIQQAEAALAEIEQLVSEIGSVE